MDRDLQPGHHGGESDRLAGEWHGGLRISANTLLPAGGYLVVAASATTFHTKHPGVANYLGNWVGSLSNIDDNVELHDATGAQIAKVHYYTEADWAKRRQGPNDDLGYPQGWIWISDADGGGKTLELANPALSNNEGQNWKMSVATGGTPGAANGALTTI